MEWAPGPGTVLLGKYRVESVLGRGGMGMVLRVTHLHLGEELAIKVLMPEGAVTADLSARFLREAQAVVRLRGEHVARVTDIGFLPEGLPYMVMEYLRGIDLAGDLRRRGTLAPGEVVDYALQACEALAEAHAHGIVHRDIKPANLFVTTRPDGTPLIKVLDFGISKTPISTSGFATKTDVVMGTAGYMSPEQMKATKDVDARTDIWALGVVLYECLTGRRPFEGESFSAVVLMAGTEPPPPMDPRIPRGVQSVVLRCLEKDRRARFPTIAALAAALAPFARDKRAASTVVDRTNLMLKRPGSASEAIAEPGSSQNGATVDQRPHAPAPPSPSAPLTESTQRRAIFGGIVVVVAITLVAVVAQRGSGRSRERDLPNDGSASGGSSAAVAVHAVDAAELAIGTVPDASAPPMAPTDDEKAQKLAQCTEANAQKKWLDLLDCAAALDALGVKDKARTFRSIATQETLNERIDDNVRTALRNGSFKEAQALLRSLSADSVYHRSLSDLFDKADGANVEDTKRKVAGFLAGHDCNGLRRFATQQLTGATGTDKVLTVVEVALARCTEKAPFASRPIPGKGSGNGGGSGSAVVAPTPPKVDCSPNAVDDMLTLASNQFSNGYASAALQVMNKALYCKQDVRMYRYAATYACAAHDSASASLYLAKVPAQYQAAIQQKCQQEHTDLGSPAP